MANLADRRGDPSSAASSETVAWAQTCATLRSEMGEATYGSWIAPAKLRRARSGSYVLVTPTGLARDWIRRNAWRRIGELWTELEPRTPPLDLVSRVEFDGEIEEAPAAADPRLATPGRPSKPALVTDNYSITVSRPTGLQERFRFDSFVAGPSNEFALSVARRVASFADGCFNPVLFHGPYGFGKTHLLNAIAWEATRAYPDKKIVYLTAERFLQTFVRAVMDRAGPAFKDDLRGADLLLIDDVHFIGGKKSSEEELFHTLTALMGEGRRIVFSSDRPPQALAEVDARLRSHLGSGLVCGVEAADHALRLGILERKLALLSDSLGVECRGRPDVLNFLADRFPSSVRELEGGMTTLVAKAGDRMAQLTVEEAEVFLRAHLRGAPDKRITVDEIQRAVCEHYGLKREDLLSERRTRAVARPRQMAMYLAKSLTVRSYPDIGRRFGGRDHTTVLHGVKRIEQLRAEDPALAADLAALTLKLRS